MFYWSTAHAPVKGSSDTSGATYQPHLSHQSLCSYTGISTGHHKHISVSSGKFSTEVKRSVRQANVILSLKLLAECSFLSSSVCLCCSARSGSQGVCESDSVRG